MRTLFLDESGYTGSNVLDKQQPAFVISTIGLSEAECLELKNQFFSEIQASELKHVDIAKRPKGQKMVIEFLNHLTTMPNAFKLGLVHKEYALVGKCVDILTETAAHETGFNIYRQGFNLALTNVLFLVLPTLAGQKFYDRMLSRFQKMVRSRTRGDYESFFDLIRRPHRNKDVDKLLDFLRVYDRVIGYREFSETLDNNQLDLALTTAVQIMGSWRSQIEGEIVLYHDISSNMSRQSDVWNALMDPSLPSTEVGYDRRRLTFPIAVKETKFEESKNWAGLQLADVLAGATSRAAEWTINEEDSSDSYGQVLAEFVRAQVGFTIWPSRGITPEELGTVGVDAEDPINYIMKVIRSVDKNN